MKFTKHQKDIIKKINSGEIYDIVSYLQAFNLTTFRKIDKEAIEMRMRAEENGATYKKLKEGVSVLHTSSSYNSALGIHMPHIETIIPRAEDFEEVEAIISYRFTKKTIETGMNSTYVFDYCEGIRFTNSFSDIKNFLTIWQYLKSENLILEVDKKIESSDFEVFFEYKPITETAYWKKAQSKKKTDFKLPENMSQHKATSIFDHDDPKRIKDCRDYVDYFFEYNKNHETVCHQFLGKQIIANADLELFIKRKFHTKEQVNNFLNLLPAYLALAMTLIITIYQEWDNNKDMDNILSKLSTIESRLENFSNSTLTSSDLDYIEQQLEEILESTSNHKEIDDKINKIIQEIKNSTEKLAE